MPDEDENDRIDVAAVLDGDEDAYARLVERHGPAVQKQMRNFTRDPLLAEELIQDVFVEAYLSLDGYRGDAPFRHWLSRIATLTGYKFWKKRDRDKRTIPLDGAAELAAPESGGEAGDPSAAADLLFGLLAELPAEDRLLMTLMYIERIGQDEMAKRTGATRVAIAVKLYRAKKKLRRIGEKEPWKGRLEWILS